MKIAFFGTPEFTVSFLDYLAEQHLKPELIITGPDVPVGRKQIIQSPQPKIWAEKESVQCIQPQSNLLELTDILSKENWDLFIVIAYGKILPEKLITIPKYGTINIHYSLLPRYRGASPIEHALLNGDIETGVCIQQMVYELDAGDIIISEKTHILPTDTHITLRERLNEIAKPLLLQSITILQNKKLEFTHQDITQKTITKKIKKADGLIKLDEDAIHLWRKYCAYYNWPGLFFFDIKNNKTYRIKITKAHIENSVFVIDTVTPEGKKEMSYSDYLNWY
jgi:methionyl-tRNA formyltransferase